MTNNHIMKPKLLLSILLLISGFAYAQDTVNRANQLTKQITEQYAVLKSNKKVKHGEYTAFTQNGVLARGRYANGKRVGEWIFGSSKGKLIQNYNYDTKKMVVVDGADAKGSVYTFIDSVKKSDTITDPIKIGGNYYSLMPLMFDTDLFTSIHFDFPDEEKLNYIHVFTVSPSGEITRHEVFVKTPNKEKTYTLKDKYFDNDLKEFVPATINGKPVECKVAVKTMMSVRTSTSVTTTTTRTGSRPNY